MLRPGFIFDISADDILLLDTDSIGHTAYNTRYQILHHHDFPRVDGRILPPTSEQLEQVNAKYQWLFKRMHDDIGRANNVLLVSEGLQYEFRWIDPAVVPPLPQPSQRRIGELIQEYCGMKTTLVSVCAGESSTVIEPGAIYLRRPDDRTRIFDENHRLFYAEPVNVYEKAFTELGLMSRQSKNRSTLDVSQHAPPF
jgi:hypothetical protein